MTPIEYATIIGLIMGVMIASMLFLGSIALSLKTIASDATNSRRALFDIRDLLRTERKVQIYPTQKE